MGGVRAARRVAARLSDLARESRRRSLRARADRRRTGRRAASAVLSHRLRRAARSRARPGALARRGAGARRRLRGARRRTIAIVRAVGRAADDLGRRGAGAPRAVRALPKSLVFVNWHYGAEPTYAPYIERIANAGFEQMVAPGADNWNEIYPDIDARCPTSRASSARAKRRDVLGLFQTVWHDDGESLYEATWYPVTFAAANAWRAPRRRATRSRRRSARRSSAATIPASPATSRASARPARCSRRPRPTARRRVVLVRSVRSQDMQRSRARSTLPRCG